MIYFLTEFCLFVRQRAFSLILVTFTFTSVQAAADIQKVTAPSGVAAWLIEDHTVPVISISLSFKRGAAQDPVGKEGLAKLLSHLLDEGAGPYDAEQFHAQLQQDSIQLTFAASYDHMSANLRTTSPQLMKACALLKVALTQPRLASKEVEKIRSTLISSLKNYQKLPEKIADKTFRTQFMTHHPYGRPFEGTEESLAKITIQDLKKFIAQGFTRDTLTIGVCGDITPAQLAHILDDTFKGLPVVSTRPEISPLLLPKVGKTTIIQADFPQSYVMFGCNGLDYQHPDYIKLPLLNHVLGEGFTSRLVDEIRVKRGNAYSLSTMINNYQHGFTMLGTIGSDNERVLESVQLVKSIWQQVQEKGITVEELEEARSNLIGGYALKFSTSLAIADMLNHYQKKGYTIDYPQRREQMIQSITLDQINAFARKFLNPNELNFVIVGNPKIAPKEITLEKADSRDGVHVKTASS